jgi:replicative DNA helicase Mcm
MLNNSGLHSRVPIKLVEGLGIDLSKSGYSRISPSAYRFIFSKNRKMLYERLKVMENGIDAKSLSKIIKRNLKSTQQYLNSLVKKGLVEKYKVNGKNAYKLTVIGKRLISKLDLIQKLKDSHLGFVRVKKIEIENPTNKYVYDFSVDGKENFIAGFGGVCCHNTGAGLTATVVRDEEFLGGWVLEAGALVMCNRSLICLCPGTRIIVNGKIVEIDKLFDSLKFEKVKCGSNLIDVGNIKGIVPSFDLSSLKTDLHNSKFIGRRKYSGEILNLRFKSGFSLRLTPEHELLDGNKLIWKKAKDFSKGDLVVAPLKLPSIKNDIYIFDLIPGDWKVCLEKNEKKLIKEKILEKYKSIAEFNKKFGINKRVFSGGNQLSLKKFKEIATDLGILEEWRKKPLKYGRINSSKKIKIIKVTPELGYILGFIFGDGYLVRKVGHGGISVNQSIKHEKYIKAFVRCWEKVFGEKPHVREFKTISNLNGRRIESIGKNIYYGSNLLVILYDALVGKSLENILSLPDNILKAFIAGAFDSDGCISIKKKKKYRVAHVEFLLSDEENVNLNFMLALRRFDIYSRLVKSKNKVSIIRITGRKDVINLKNAIKNYSEKIKIEIPKRINKVSSFSDKLPRFIVAEICEEIINQINTSILNKLGISSIVYDYKKLKYQPSRDQLLKIIRKCGPFLNDETKEKIQKMVKRDFLLDEIIEIKRENYDGFVYDLYVPETNNFVANGVFVHNCIDEFEKIEKTDQIALHEAMEQNTISIAKASIVATLPAQTSILAGGNPKLGRFDPYIPIKEQIDVPETLLSRFDLKFALRDIPNPELDAKVAEHILKSRHYGEEEIKPAIEADLLKKYVAYARKNCHPKLSKEAGEEIKNFFLSLREKVGVEEAAVPITLRQYEALIRLAEASAKVQLRDTVTREDAIRAINLMKASLREFGFEAETGRFDVDRLEGRITASERGKIRTVLDIIEELTKTVGNIIPKEDVIKAAKDKGIKEFDVEKILNELKNKGDIFEPKVGFLQKM